MSTLKTTNLQHPSAASPAIVLDAAGDATYSGVHDFSAATVTGAPQGLVHINTITFSAVSSVSLNDVFTSDYDNYLIVFKGTGSTTAANLQFRMRAAGSDASGASTYVSQSVQGNGTSVAATRETTSYVVLGQIGNTTTNAARWELFSPFIAEDTVFLSQMQQSENTSRVRNAAGVHDVATSYDGITLFPGSGTMTGTIRIYGYRNEA